MSANYRILNKEELEILQPDFIQFLASNSIDAATWKVLLAEDRVRVNSYIEAFSKVVFEKSLSKIKYLEVISEFDAKFFHLKEDEITLLGIRVPEGGIVLRDLLNATPSQLTGCELYSGKKAYNVSRNAETFQMMENGACVSDGKWFNHLQKSFLES